VDTAPAGTLRLHEARPAPVGGPPNPQQRCRLLAGRAQVVKESIACGGAVQALF